MKKSVLALALLAVAVLAAVVIARMRGSEAEIARGGGASVSEGSLQTGKDAVNEAPVGVGPGGSEGLLTERDPQSASGEPNARVLVEGSIRVTPELADRSKQIGVVYVMIRPAGGGAPYAVARLQNPRSGDEIPYRLTEANVMLPGAPVPANAQVIARFDADGAAGPEAPGDLVGEAAVGTVGNTRLDILVSREGGQKAQ